MKLTLNLPDPLLRDLKIRAINEGRTLKDLVAELLQQGLAILAEPKVIRSSAKTRTEK